LRVHGRSLSSPHELEPLRTIATAVARHPDRLVGVGTVPLQAPELAVLEMKRCVHELGLRGIEISANVAGHELAESQFRRLFAAAEQLDVLLFMHPLGSTHGQRLSEHYLGTTIRSICRSPIPSAPMRSSIQPSTRRFSARTPHACSN
jgi:predicted TIM-barrel fold metal-dependent hydrolase